MLVCFPVSSCAPHHSNASLQGNMYQLYSPGVAKRLALIWLIGETNQCGLIPIPCLTCLLESKSTFISRTLLCPSYLSSFLFRVWRPLVTVSHTWLRQHPPMSDCLSVSAIPSVSIYAAVFISVSICHYICLCLYLYVHLSVYRHWSPCMSLSSSLYVFLSLYQSTDLSVSLFDYIYIIYY